MNKITDHWPLNVERQKLIIRNAHRLCRHKFKGVPFWSFVSEITGHGSGYSAAICEEIGVDPCRDASLKIP